MKKALLVLFGLVILFESVSAQTISNFRFEEVRINPLGSSSRLRIGRNAEIAKFRIQNPGDKNILLQSLTLRNIGRSDLSKSLVNPVVTTSTGTPLSVHYSASGRNINFDFGDGFEIKRGNSQILRVMATIGYARSRDTIQLQIRRDEDLNIIDKSSRFGIPHNGERVTFKEHTLSPGSIFTSRSGNSRRISAASNRYYQRASSSSTGQTSETKPVTNPQPQSFTQIRTTSRDSFAPGARDIVFLNQILTSNRNFTSDGIFFPLDRSRSNAANGFEDTFIDLNLYINGRQQDEGFFTERNGVIGLEFDTSLDISSGSHRIQVVGRIGRSAQNGDRLRLQLRTNGFLDVDYY